jgi:hypothetical protein
VRDRDEPAAKLKEAVDGAIAAGREREWLIRRMCWDETPSRILELSRRYAESVFEMSPVEFRRIARHR